MKYLLIIYCSCLIKLSSSLAQQKSKTESILSGSEIYNDFCIRCHLVNGEGIKGTFPPLRKSDYLLKNIDKSIAGLKYGMKGKIKVNNIIYDGIMINQGLDDEEIADVMNYILNQWGNESKEIITPNRVSGVSKSILK